MQAKSTQIITHNICFDGPLCSLQCESLTNSCLSSPECEALGGWPKVRITENREIEILRTSKCINKYGIQE